MNPDKTAELPTYQGSHQHLLLQAINLLWEAAH